MLATTEALARWLAGEIRTCVERSGQCRLALSGGSTPRLLFEHLAQPDLDLAPEQVHPVDGTVPPEEAAKAYDALVGNLPLDIVLLVMGGGGHTASLFPGGPGLLEQARSVLATRSPLPPSGDLYWYLDRPAAGCLGEDPGPA